jgi:hypothetical protein
MEFTPEGGLECHRQKVNQARIKDIMKKNSEEKSNYRARIIRLGLVRKAVGAKKNPWRVGPKHLPRRATEA